LEQLKKSPCWGEFHGFVKKRRLFVGKCSRYIYYRRRDEMETTVTAESATALYNLGSIQSIPPGEGRVFRVGETDVTIFRVRDGQIFATQSLCPHRGGPLADGLVGAGKVVCPLHAYVFDLSTGRPVDNACDHLRTYPVTLNEAGEILLTMTV
jgi:nitrite reductase (NADH) small subunit